MVANGSAVEVRVERSGGEAGSAGDVLDSDLVVAAFEKLFHRRSDELFPRFRSGGVVVGSPAAGLVR